jgi:hypothetical protein
LTIEIPTTSSAWTLLVCGAGEAANISATAVRNPAPDIVRLAKI